MLEDATMNGAGMKLPNFLIIGANKAGTSTLYDHLRAHANVFMPSVKEPHFFSYLGEVPDGEPMVESVTPALCTLEDYSQLFAAATEDQHVRGEASTGYLCTTTVPPRVQEAIPDARLIAILRDPAERAWSAWRMMKRVGHEAQDDPLEALQSDADSQYRYLLNGRYGMGLSRWLEFFPREQLRIYLLDDLAADANGVMADIFSFLGVTPIPIDANHRKNAAPEQDPPPPAALRRWLVDYYREDTLVVEELLKRDLSAWRRP